MERSQVRTREDFEAFLFNLLDHIDAIEPDNNTLDSYFRAVAAWLRDSDRFYAKIGEDRDPSIPDWQLVADMLAAALVYE